MLKSFILQGVLSTAIMFSGISFTATNINTDSLTGMAHVNMQKTIEEVCIGRVLAAEPENKEFFVFDIKNLEYL